MQNDPNMDHTGQSDLLIEREDWELAFEPFRGNAYAALKLGVTLAMMRSFLEGQLFKSGQAIEALDEAMEVVFPYTEFHQASFGLFVRFAEGRLTHDEEQMLNALGVKF